MRRVIVKGVCVRVVVFVCVPFAIKPTMTPTRNKGPMYVVRCACVRNPRL